MASLVFTHNIYVYTHTRHMICLTATWAETYDMVATQSSYILRRKYTTGPQVLLPKPCGRCQSQHGHQVYICAPVQLIKIKQQEDGLMMSHACPKKGAKTKHKAALVTRGTVRSWDIGLRRVAALP